jgi:lysophospholipase L1-like esterase
MTMELKNKTIFFLGSSVTYGSAAGGVSMADILAERLQCTCIKEAVSGTTLADVNERSYVSRLKMAKPSVPIDLFVCQLSTNDAKRNIPLCDVERAIREIITFVKENYACPIVFYTGTRYESEAYERMIALLYELQKEYGFAVLDLFYDKEMSAVSPQDYSRYMKDPIHPTLIGYREWWTPKFAKFLRAL